MLGWTEMMREKLFQTVMAAVVLLVAGVFFAFAYAQGGVRPIEGYPVSATFTDIGGLSADSDVQISGVKVGMVTDESVDPKSGNAVVSITIRGDIRLPEDSVAAIESSGLIGGAIVELLPGSSKQTIPSGGVIAKVKNYRSLETTVGHMIFSLPGGESMSTGAN